MSTVTLSSSFEILIPEEIRQSLQLTPGEKLHVISFAGRVELIPVRSIQSMRGFIQGMDTSIETGIAREFGRRESAAKTTRFKI